MKSERRLRHRGPDWSGLVADEQAILAHERLAIVDLDTGAQPITSADGNLYVASEMKALAEVCKTIEDFPPGHFWDSKIGHPVRYYAPEWREYETVEGKPVNLDLLRSAFEDAVRRQLMSDVPYGVLLSGGLDSSLVAVTAKQFVKNRIHRDGRHQCIPALLCKHRRHLLGERDILATMRYCSSRLLSISTDVITGHISFWRAL